MLGSMIEFFIPMEKIPTTTHQQKQVTCRNGKPHFYEPPKLIQARAKYMAHFSHFAPKTPLRGCVRLVIKWCFPLKDGTYNGQYKGSCCLIVSPIWDFGKMTIRSLLKSQRSSMRIHQEFTFDWRSSNENRL